MLNGKQNNNKILNTGENRRGKNVSKRKKTVFSPPIPADGNNDNFYDGYDSLCNNDIIMHILLCADRCTCK